MLAQFQSTSNGEEVVAAIFLILSVGWFIFVVWWMLSMKNEIQRIRETIEHRVYDFDEDDEDDENDSGLDEIERLARLGKLHQEGVLTDEEFTKIKEGLFARDS